MSKLNHSKPLPHQVFILYGSILALNKHHINRLNTVLLLSWQTVKIYCMLCHLFPSKITEIL